ncbi:MAG: YncE family protein [Litorimonas sp.]
MTRRTFLLSAALWLGACSAGVPAPIDAILLVGNKGEDTVSFVNLSHGGEEARIPTSHGWPHEIAISPDRTEAAVVNYQDHHIDILDMETRTIVRTVDLGEHTRPHGIEWLDDGRIVASTEGNQSIVEISPDGAVTGIRTNEDGTHMVVVSPDGRRAYTANLGAGTVSLIDLDTDRLVKTVPAGAGTEGIDLTPDGRELWVSNREADTVTVFDAQSLDRLASLDVGDFPLRLQISPDGRYAVTSNLRDASLSVIDVETRALVRTLEVGRDGPVSMQVTILFSGAGDRIYVAETGTDTVAEVDFASGDVLRRFAVGRQGDGLAIVY